MLGLKPTPLEAALPGQSRRRTWSHPELSSHTVLILTFDSLHLAPLTGTPKPEMLAAIDAGADLDVLLGPLATEIDLDAIRRLKLDLLANSLNIEYDRSGLDRSRLQLTFATHEAADACFTKLWRRLGDKFQLAPYKRDAWHSIRAPLALLVGILLITAGMAGFLSIHEDMAARRISNIANHSATEESSAVADLTKARGGLLINWLNWKVVCGLGGVAAACSQVWLYRRLTAPPVFLELNRM
jgi:hypothetical protein